ncbi:N-acetyltransferase family protein [Patulibacter sp. S7RM1-6]
MPAAEVPVRPLRPDDRDAWQPLWDGYLRFYREELDPAITAVTFERLCEAGDALFGLVAVDGTDRPVGFAHALLHGSTWSPRGYCYLEDLYVGPDARGGAVGRALIDATADEARRRGATKLYWHTQSYNGRARSLYDQAGALSSQVVYERELE